MSNITVTHAESGLVHAEVVRRERITPHMTRVTLGGPDVARFEFRGFDQWFRLALPIGDEGALDRMPQRFGFGGYLSYLSIPKGQRPVVRNYTVRDYRESERELDIDFVVHGSEGVAGPWAARAVPGERVALIDQGCGWRGLDADWNLIVADESGLPAALGILRDLPRAATGHAIIELFDERDRQDVDAPVGVEVHWLVRAEAAEPGSAALPALEALDFPDGTPYAFAVGEQALAAGARRHLVRQRGVPKGGVTFSGYWRR
ncbi:siderophore-interacting protein [Microbacterium karelineae]|uniref:siderophore-interacting protein n=1 Tax=Microbacterium karelineae TaxID=2654283 RepID=UPI0012EA7D57|nr:siderophore-interacting protein [Microbacterium karelineae]